MELTRCITLILVYLYLGNVPDKVGHVIMLVNIKCSDSMHLLGSVSHIICEQSDQ